MAADGTLDQIKLYVKALDADPHSGLIFPLVELYQQVGLVDAAYDAIRNWLQNNPQSVQGQLVLGTLQRRRGVIDEARSLFERILRQQPDHQDATLRLAELEIDQKNYHLARKRLGDFRLNFGECDEWCRLTRLLEVQEQDEDVSNPEPPAVVTPTMADLYFRQGLREKSLVMYRQLLEREPENILYQNRVNQIVAERESSAQSPADVLQRWLVAIERRRSHV